MLLLFWVVQQGGALDRQTLEEVIGHAVQGSMSAALVSIQSDVHHLDRRLVAWSQHTQSAWQSLQEELSQLRRGTADDISAVTARIDRLEAQKVVHLVCSNFSL